VLPHSPTTGAADAAFLPASLAMLPELRGGTAIPVPASLHARIEHSAAVVAGARQPGLARAFLALVTGERGRAILARHRYGLP